MNHPIILTLSLSFSQSSTDRQKPTLAMPLTMLPIKIFTFMNLFTFEYTHALENGSISFVNIYKHFNRIEWVRAYRFVGISILFTVNRQCLLLY